jgi:CRISPR system Cascade subunit CasE
MQYYLSRMCLARDPSTTALKMLIDPDNRALAMDSHHRLIWSTFAGDPDKKRDFLWRAEGNGRFMVLSKHKPSPSPLFDQHKTKTFAPQLSSGDKLQFLLRVNATKTRPEKFAPSKDRRVDIVMHALHGIPKLERAEKRHEIANAVASDWFAVQGMKFGFQPEIVAVADYSVQELPNHRGSRKGQPQFGVLELTGELTVTDPEAFLAKLVSGFGRAKAFGCGLMLVKRA